MSKVQNKKRSAATDGHSEESKLKRMKSGMMDLSDFPGQQKAVPWKETTDEDFRIVAGSYERILYGVDAKWQVEEGQEPNLHLEPIFIFPAHIGCIKTVAVGGNYLASGSTDEVIKLYDIKKRKEMGSLLGQHQGSITCLEFYSKTHMLSGSDDGHICIWRTKDWECLSTMKGHQGRVNSVSVHPTGKIALSVSADKTVRLWNLMKGRKANVIKLNREGLQVIWSHDGTKYAIMSDNDIVIYRIEGTEPIHEIKLRSRFHAISFVRQGEVEYLITGSEDKNIRIWGGENMSCLLELGSHQTRIKAIHVIESTKPKAEAPTSILVSASSDGWIKCWDLPKAFATIPSDTTKDSPNAFNNTIGEYNTKSRLTCLTVSPPLHL